MAAAAAIVAVPNAAHASIPSGTGWSGSWEYYGGNSIKVLVDVPGGKIVANGWDALGVRAFVVTVTDTVADGKCAYVKWEQSTGVTEKWACGNGTSVQFQPGSSDSTITATVCRDTVAHGAQTNCNPLIVPTSKYDEYIRTPGNKFEWRYMEPGHEGIEDWGAWLTLGTVNFDYFGVDDAPDGKRWIMAWVTSLDNPAVCGSGKIFYGDVPSSATVCGDNQITELPNTTVTGKCTARAAYGPSTTTSTSTA